MLHADRPETDSSRACYDATCCEGTSLVSLATRFINVFFFSAIFFHLFNRNTVSYFVGFASTGAILMTQLGGNSFQKRHYNVIVLLVCSPPFSSLQWTDGVLR